MGKKKISQFPAATPVSGDKFLIEKADGTYKNVEFDDLAGSSSADLAAVLTNGNNTNGIPIVSETSINVLTVSDVGFFATYNDGFTASGLGIDNSGVKIISDINANMLCQGATEEASFLADVNKALTNYTDGTNGGFSEHTATENTYQHSIKNVFTAPVNDFGNIEIYSNRIQLSTTNRIVWGTSYSSSPYIYGINTGTEKTIDHYSSFGSNYTRHIQKASATEAYISMRSNVIGSWPESEVKVDGVNASVLIDAPNVINIGTTYAAIINYGNSTTIHNFLGTAIYETQINSYVQDKLITLNYGGSIGSGIGVGFEIEENNVITGYIKTNSARNGFSILTPAISYKSDLNLNLLTADRTFSFPDASGTLAITSDLSSYLQKANNLSDLANTKTARTNLGLETAANGGNAAYNIGVEKLAYTGTAFTAARIWTLPDSTSLNAWDEKVVADILQTVTSTNTLTIAVQSGKSLNGVVNGTVVMQSAGSWRRFAPDGSGGWTYDAEIVRQTQTQTLTNKRITQRVSAITSSSTPTPNADTDDMFKVTALAAAATITNPTGTPTEGQSLLIRIKDNGTARALTFDTQYRFSSDQTAPTTTVISKTLYMGFVWNSDDSKWDCLGYINNI